MLFDLILKSSKKNTAFTKASGFVKIFCNNKSFKTDFENFLSENYVQINTIVKQKIIKEKKYSFESYQSITPEYAFIEKVNLDKNFTSDFFRNYFAGVIQTLDRKGINKLFIELPDFESYEKYFISEENFYQSIIEGIYLGNYSFDKYQSEKKKKQSLSIEIITKSNKINSILKKVLEINKSVCLARDLVNEPALTLTPTELEKRVKKEFKAAKVAIKVFNRAQLQKKKMNSILAVGDASIHPPRLIQLHYKPANKAKCKIVLVGKGVTYDTGGLSIKPTSGMLEMKGDMGGAATVIGAIKSAAALNLDVEIIGLIPTVENMLAGNSYKPGDVITSYSGKTIEVKDTDAEGRIILADALTFANEFKPDQILDFATLTGAVVVALGENTAGLMTQDKNLSDNLIKVSELSNERLWPLPFDNSYNSLIESDIADVSNLGPRWGGAITAGKFLEYFVDEKIPWAHIDLAGPALKHDAKNYTKKYDTGFGVRMITEYLLSL